MSEFEARRSVVTACRAMNALGINQGTSGNVSLRHGADMLISPSAVPYDEMRAEDVAAMPIAGERGAWRGPLHGVPYAAKDIFDVEGTATTCHSKLRKSPRAAADAAAIVPLRVETPRGYATPSRFVTRAHGLTRPAGSARPRRGPPLGAVPSRGLAGGGRPGLRRPGLGAEHAGPRSGRFGTAPRSCRGRSCRSRSRTIIA